MVVAGDPCYDRILTSLPDRDRYRAALGVQDNRRIVLVTSTWSGTSLFGQLPTLLRTILADLPIDDYAVAAVLHPNIWDGHSPWQIRTWLADCQKAGLILIPPFEGWRAAAIAADCIIGDHGSVTAYGAAVDRPTLLAAFPTDEVVPGTVVDELGRLAPHLDPTRPLRPQLDAAIDQHEPGRYAPVTALASSAPGSALSLLRATCYRLLALPEPDWPVSAELLPTDGLAEATSEANHVHCTLDPTGVTLTRYPAAVQPVAAPGANAHLAVHDRCRDSALRGAADVLITEADRLAEAMSTRQGIRLAAAPGPDGACLLLDRHAGPFTARGHDPAVCASALYAVLIAGQKPPAELTVRIGGTERRITVRPGHS